jgi:cytidylate kinase
MASSMVIAIDGPAGAGKSTVARAAADALGYTYLDTGAMYRCVGLAAERRGVPAAQAAREATIELGDRIRLDGADVTDAIRTPEVSAAASRVAADPEVRTALVRSSRRCSERRLGGRGPRHRHVCRPGRRVKVFLTAPPSARGAARAESARRRVESLREQAPRRARRPREHSPLSPRARRVPSTPPTSTRVEQSSRWVEARDRA